MIKSFPKFWRLVTSQLADDLTILSSDNQELIVSVTERAAKRLDCNIGFIFEIVLQGADIQ